MTELSLAALFGYDPALVRRLPAARQHSLGRIAVAWVFACSMLAWPVGYAVYAVEHSIPLAWIASTSAFALAVNMVRLVVAGGGASLHPRDGGGARFRPGYAPLAVFALLSLVLAQPALLPVERARLDPLVEAHRAELMAQKRVASARTGTPLSAHHQHELARCEFVALRLRHLWDAPQRTAPMTMAFMLAVLLPALWSRVLSLRTLQTYEAARIKQRLRETQRDAQRVAQRAQSELGQFSSYSPERQDAARRWLRGSRP